MSGEGRWVEVFGRPNMPCHPKRRLAPLSAETAGIGDAPARPLPEGGHPLFSQRHLLTLELFATHAIRPHCGAAAVTSVSQIVGIPKGDDARPADAGAGE